MPSALDTPVLQVDANVIHKVDTSNPQNLFSMWTDSVAQGRRLENLSWRLWTRETFCVEDTTHSPISIPSDSFMTSADMSPKPTAIPQRDHSTAEDVPQLSGSVESVADDETEELSGEPGAVEIMRPRIRRQDSCGSSRSRGRERHITSDDLEKMVVSIISQHDEAVEEDAIPEPTSSPAAKLVPSKKATFALGGSSSCEDSMSDPSRSLEMHQSAMSHMIKRKSAASVHSIAGPSSAAKIAHPEEEGSLKSAMLSARNLNAQKKQTSFSNQVMTRTIPPAPVFEDDSESDDIDESAIDDDDDDSSDWEDSNEESGRSSIDEKNMFQRVDSKVHLPSRRSLITLMIQKSERELKNGLMTSQSTMALSRPRVARQPPSLVASPNDSDDAALMMRPRGRPQSNLRPINEIPRSAAQPIMTSAAAGGQYQAAYSPRTNRRNMLSTELTESLRRHLLWERSQKTSTANAVLKRRHTSQDVANLKQYPETPHMVKENDAGASSWDQYLNRDAFNGYHAKGW
ncbi:duf1752 domain containing protein [Grosmannia clavigera kw1407]|uniref:Duf1752 domain containing protein n=1 Tax=Grosmannia clavigera (strain kw1407 / UAMH 11150) TaxID=655863 RepID=F0XLU9_GROCL|nr:duf1752 domain containing protein [Grosmannia clavigera kw1407]EFX01176.1 duf1752 domain containing protein [Grosmannia clavigera kw1407]